MLQCFPIYGKIELLKKIIKKKNRRNKMEYQTKILIADENTAQRQALLGELRRAGYKNIEEASNGEEALIKIGRYHPDVAIIDVWLSKLDGIGVLRNCRSLNFAPDKKPAFIVVSMVSNQNVFIEAAHAGAELCLLKPYNMESLCEHINSLAKSRELVGVNSENSEDKTPDIETQVTKIIHQIGDPAHFKGYQYLRTAILLTVNDSDIINSVTKILYPSVAKK